jgi:hypothetical protein
MDKKENSVARVFAVLFSVLFVITAFISILLINIQNQAFNPETYKQALSESGIYDRLPELIGEQIVSSVNRNPCIQNPTACTEEQSASTPAYLSSVDASEWAGIISKLVDPDWFKTQLESAIDQVMTFLKTPGQPLNLDISLVELKGRLGGEDGYQAIVSLLNSLEPCTSGDLLNLPSAMLNGDGLSGLPLCRPSETVLKLGEDAIRTSLKGAADKLPDNTSTFFDATANSLGTGLVAAQRMLQMLRIAVMVSLIIPLVLLLVITLLVVRSFKGFLKWWGVPLVAVAALCFLSTLLISPLARTMLVQLPVQGLAPELVEVVKTAIMAAVKSFNGTLIVQAGILSFIGCLMILVSFLIRPKSETTPA